MKKLLCSVLSVLIVLLCVPSASAEEAGTSARAYVLYCPDNGETLLSDNAEEELPMASTTKIMTTLLTLEAYAQDNRTVEFTDEMSAEGSSMYLRIGEKVTLYDLAVGMMMQSGNDAANAAAIAIAGSIEAFAGLMNEKAREIGMERTHFVTPSGLDDEDHYSCARDMALLMAYAMQNEDFAFLSSRTEMTVRFVYPRDKFMTYANHNKLLKRYDGCIGGKTGYTDTAGRCLVTAARRDGLTLIAVTLDDRDDWNDHAALYDYGFENYAALSLYGESFTAAVVGGREDAVSLYVEETVAVIPKSSAAPDQSVILPSFLYAPVKEGETVGKVIYTLNGVMIAETNLRAAQNVAYNDDKRNFFTYIKDLLHWHS